MRPMRATQQAIEMSTTARRGYLNSQEGLARYRHHGTTCRALSTACQLRAEGCQPWDFNRPHVAMELKVYLKRATVEENYWKPYHRHKRLGKCQGNSKYRTGSMLLVKLPRSGHLEVNCWAESRRTLIFGLRCCQLNSDKNMPSGKRGRQAHDKLTSSLIEQSQELDNFMRELLYSVIASALEVLVQLGCNV
eukprot:6481018-Amphidinium_carterae.1